TEPGADVIQWLCTGNDSQKWYIQMKLEPLTGELMTFDRLDTEHAGGWMIREDLAVGAELYGDREGVTYTQLPEAVSGAEYLLTACDGKNLDGDQGELTALQDMTLYVAQDARVESAPAWLADWTKTDMTAQSSKDVTYVLYSREMNAGESILLGTNGQSSGCVNYTVFAVKAASQPAAVRGDADANGTVSIADIIMVQKWLLNSGEITDCQNADMNADGVIDIFDLALLKHLVLAK
ncbi:MAG: dockerin type I repeat-containing protein, partial [Oscillospiraceae bacterium]|nr:dockerin type I repeat-containing protein [Oscillospiraceae bacterium]